MILSVLLAVFLAVVPFTSAQDNTPVTQTKNKESIAISEAMDEVMIQEVTKVKEEFSQKVRSLFDRRPLGWNLDTIAYLSLAAGIWIGWTIILGWNPIAGLAGAVDATVTTVTDPGNARVIMFTFAIGALIALVEANGGVQGFVRWVEERRWVDDGRKAQMLAWFLG